MNIYGIQKDGTGEFIFKAAMEKQTQRKTYGHGERGGEGEMYGESNVETYITMWKIDSQWEFAVCLRDSNRGSVYLELMSYSKFPYAGVYSSRLSIYNVYNVGFWAAST